MFVHAKMSSINFHIQVVDKIHFFGTTPEKLKKELLAGVNLIIENCTVNVASFLNRLAECVPGERSEHKLEGWWDFGADRNRVLVMCCTPCIARPESVLVVYVNNFINVEIGPIWDIPTWRSVSTNLLGCELFRPTVMTMVGFWVPKYPRETSSIFSFLSPGLKQMILLSVLYSWMVNEGCSREDVFIS